METTIRVSENIKKQLDRLKMFERESYNDILELLLEDNMKINEKTKREIAEARKRIEEGAFYTLEEAEKKLNL